MCNSLSLKHSAGRVACLDQHDLCTLFERELFRSYHIHKCAFDSFTRQGLPIFVKSWKVYRLVDSRRPCELAQSCTVSGLHLRPDGITVPVGKLERILDNDKNAYSSVGSTPSS